MQAGSRDEAAATMTKTMSHQTQTSRLTEINVCNYSCRTAMF
jgi:hypothetical protein